MLKNGVFDVPRAPAVWLRPLLMARGTWRRGTSRVVQNRTDTGRRRRAWGAVTVTDGSQAADHTDASSRSSGAGTRRRDGSARRSRQLGVDDRYRVEVEAVGDRSGSRRGTRSVRQVVDSHELRVGEAHARQIERPPAGQRGAGQATGDALPPPLRMDQEGDRRRRPRAASPTQVARLESARCVTNATSRSKPHSG